jgi:actin-related protein
MDAKNASKQEYELPDGTTINIDGVFASACVDLLFDPDEYGIENLDGGLGNMLAKSISMCDRDLQPDLYKNIVLSGGTTMIRGFSERVKTELKGTSEGQVNVVPDSSGIEPGYNSQRRIGAWIGGSILASLDTFNKISVSKQDYEDSGSANIVHRKTVT